jgi:putative permease
MNTKASWILWLKIFGLLGLILAAFAYLTTVTIIFIPFICAVVLNVMLAPVISSLERRDYSRDKAVMSVFLAFFALLALSLLIVPDLVTHEIDVVKGKWPETKLKMDALLQDTESFVNGMVPADNKIDLVHAIPDKLKTIGEETIRELPHLLAEGIVALLLIPLFTYFLLRDGRAMKKSLVAAVPNRYFEMTLSIIYRVNQQVGAYLRGLMMEASADALVGSALCMAFGIPNPFLIGLIAGMTTIMPLAGMVIACVLCPLVALFSASSAMAPMTMVGFVVLAIVLTHIIDNVVIAPLIMGHSVHMHPVAVIVSIIVASKLFGILGIVLAVPVVSILRVLVQEGYQGIKSNEYYIKNA